MIGLLLQVLAQLTTNVTDMAGRLIAAECRCTDGKVANATCTAAYVCGSGLYELSIALVIITAVIVCVLAW